MLDKYQLEQLIAFADEGTLSAAAEKLHISQPALSKSMKKIEEDMGVSLFLRERNKITLNKTGEYAVESARKVFQAGQEMMFQVLEYDRRLRTISVGSCAPFPMWEIVPQLSVAHPSSSISGEVRHTHEIEAGLINRIYDVGVLPYEKKVDGYSVSYWGEENLGFSLPVTHPLSGRESLRFEDLDGSQMLVFSDIGFWDEIHRKNMPNTEFMMLDNRDMIQTISSMSEIPTFFTDAASKRNPLPPGRIGIPIEDADAHARFYMYRKK